MNYYEVRFSYTTDIEPAIVNDILAAQLGEIGYESFTEEKGCLQAYVQESFFSEDTLQTKLKEFPLEKVQFHYTYEQIPEQNWNEVWEQHYFQPIYIGNECVIHASFHQLERHYPYDIVIDPKMAFGTGNHATTYLMTQMLLSLDVKDKEVLDMGCGTGILSILANKMGAAQVVAIDIDPWAYNNTVENIALNHAHAITPALGGADILSRFGSFDIILANINRNILLNDICYYAQHMVSNAFLLMSGFYTKDIPAIQKACEEQGLSMDEIQEKEEWAMVKVHKSSLF